MRRKKRSVPESSLPTRGKQGRESLVVNKMKNTFLKFEKGILKNRRKRADTIEIRSQVQTSADSDFRVRSPDGYPSQPSQSKHASPPRISFGRKSYAVSDVGSAKGKLSSKNRTKVDAKRDLIAFMFSQLLS